MARQRTFALGRKEPVRREPRARDLQGLSPEAIARCLQTTDGKLHLATRCIDGKLPERTHLHALVWRRRDATAISRPHDASDLRVCVSQAEIPMAVAMRL